MNCFLLSVNNCLLSIISEYKMFNCETLLQLWVIKSILPQIIITHKHLIIAIIKNKEYMKYLEKIGYEFLF